jgi:predicted signal transduction protein with EAL and GGDEF domain
VIEHRRIVRSAEVVSEKLLALLRQPFTIEGRAIHVTASIGIAVTPDHGTDADALVRNADAAMYAAKESGRNQYRIFTPELNSRAVERLKIETALRRAIERNEFSLRFQPQMSTRTQDVVGAEALLRWNSTELGSVLPEQFIPVAEEAGLIREIGAWVVREACAQLKAWQQSGLGDLRIAINISGSQISDVNLPRVISDSITEFNINPAAIELEITETVLVAATEQNALVIQSLRDLGVRIAIDDFGIGYSSMSYLGRMPAHAIKIDRSFVSSCLDRKEDAAIVSAVAALGRGLGLDVIAEGIESQAQLDMLAEVGCDLLQGYFVARPMVANELEEFVKQQRERLPRVKRGELRLA